MNDAKELRADDVKKLTKKILDSLRRMVDLEDLEDLEDDINPSRVVYEWVLRTHRIVCDTESLHQSVTGIFSSPVRNYGRGMRLPDPDIVIFDENGYSVGKETLLYPVHPYNVFSFADAAAKAFRTILVGLHTEPVRYLYAGSWQVDAERRLSHGVCLGYIGTSADLEEV